MSKYKYDIKYKYKYKDYNDFSKLFSKRPYVSSTPQTNKTQQVSPQGRTYDASQMWSPTSSAGNLYEWNRGVIAVSYDGKMIKEKLDGTYNHHADATVRILGALGIIIQNTNAPFQAGIDGANEGAIVFQSEGNNALIYFPPAISQEQLGELYSIITPRKGFNFSYTYGEEIFENQDSQSVLAYGENLKNLASVRR